jgi:Chromate transporter
VTGDPENRSTSSPAEVFRVALKLGVTSFGDPIAHLGYFERTYVQQRHWLSQGEYAGFVGLCQLLPGPTSSQVGFLIGYRSRLARRRRQLTLQRRRCRFPVPLSDDNAIRGNLLDVASEAAGRSATCSASGAG